MTDRVAENVRKMVGVDQTQFNDIGEAEKKEVIQGNRGMSVAAPGTTGATNRTSASGTAGQDLASDALINSLSENGGYGFSSGSTGATIDPDNPEKAIKDGDGNSSTAESILDGGITLVDPTNPTNGLDGLGLSNGALDSITGITDCDTGKPICLQLKGGFVPPSGWDGPNGPPDNYYTETISTSGGPPVWEWQFGVRWVYNIGGVDNFFHTPGEAFDFVEDDLGTPIESISYEEVGSGRFRVVYDIGTGPGSGLQLVAKDLCSAGVDGKCPVTEPTIPLPNWPADTCHQLVWSGGRLNSSDREATADTITRLTAGLSVLNFCFGTGRTGTFYPGKDGGFVLYETDGFGQMIGTGTYFNAQGQPTHSITTANELVRFKAA